MLNPFRHRLALAAGVAFLIAVSPIRPLARPQAQGQTSQDFAALVTRLEADGLAGRAEPVRSARLDLLRMLAAQPAADRAPILRYTIAYAAWRVAFAPAIAPSEQQVMLDDAVVQLNAVLKTRPNDVEAMGLLAGVQGARIGKAPELGMTLGPEASQLINRALRLAPSNPRLLVINGQNAFNTPPEYGGSVAQAETAFRAALTAFAAEPASAPWPNWGRFDAHVWLGQALAKRGDKAGARAEYEKALTIAPESGWVRLSLLPAVR